MNGSSSLRALLNRTTKVGVKKNISTGINRRDINHVNNTQQELTFPSPRLTKPTISGKPTVRDSIEIRKFEPKPPKEFREMSEHHWLREVDKEGVSSGLVVLQWCPSGQRWVHSGYGDTGVYVDTCYWTYYAHCKKPY